MEAISIPSLTDEEDHGNNNNINLSNGIHNDTAAINGHASHNGHHGRKKPTNAARGDPAFLRKRTERILSLQSLNAKVNFAISSRGMKVDRKTFHFLIDAWAFSGEPDAAEQAIALLHRMEDLGAAQSQTDHHPSIWPDVRSYTKVINAISRSASPHSGVMAQELLQKMNDLYESGHNPTVKPNTFTYTAVVEAHANCGEAEHAEDICELMVQKFWDEGDADVTPTARAYNAAIKAYANLGQAQRAEDVFQRMENVYLTTGLEQMKPNAYNYNSLISAWASSGQEGAAARAEEVLDRMEAQFQAGYDDVKPTTVSYNAVIDAYSTEAEHQEYNAGEKADSILRHMEGLYESGQNVDAKPNVRSYNTVINVWAKSQSDDGAHRAEEILDFMQKLVEEGDNSVRPDVHSFSTVINAWARSQKENKAERALNLLKYMKQLHKDGNENLRPNVVVANAVMNACAYTQGEAPERNRAVEIAHKVFKDLESGEYGKPDQVSYGTFMTVCSNQMPECSSRERIVDMIFQKCSKDGQVGNLVLQQMKATLSPQKYQELVGMDIDSEHSMEDLPKEWWCNVVERKCRRRRNF